MIEWLFRRWRKRNARRWAALEQVKALCDCHRARPSARDLTGHRHNCPFHPPEGWPFDQPVARVEPVGGPGTCGCGVPGCVWGHGG